MGDSFIYERVVALLDACDIDNVPLLDVVSNLFITILFSFVI
jgi:hypothetical protein